MSTHLYRVQTILPATSGLPEDDTVWSHYFRGDSATVDYDHLGGAVAAAFGTTYLMGKMGPTVSRSAAPTFRVYDYGEVPVSLPARAGSPVYTGAWASAIAAADNSGLPYEVAVCLSFHGDLTGLAETIPGGPAGPAGDTHPRARARGRMFMGPLTLTLIDTNFTAPTMLAAYRTNLAAAGAALRDNANLTADGVDWCVFSRTSALISPVVGGWVDNEFDTQRRRGRAPTARTTF